jgi:branched-chain amino acid transport system ATP-binding protein
MGETIAPQKEPERPGVEAGPVGALSRRPEPGGVILRVEKLVKDFGGLRAVDRCSLAVKRGTITGLIGPNGAGKTTLFNLITGFYKPDAGRVFFDGEEITGLPPHAVFHKGLCRTFQIPKEHRSMTVLENLMLVPSGQLGEKLWNPWFRPWAVRRQEAEIRDQALEVLEFVGLIHLRDEYAGNLSGGQKKLLELARTLMAEPKMVLLDEPGAGVNPTLMRKLCDNIERLCSERGITFLLIEHDMDLVFSLCDPVIVMSEGKKLAEGPPEEIRRDPRVLEAYLGGQYAVAEG